MLGFGAAFTAYGGGALIVQGGSFWLARQKVQTKMLQTGKELLT